MSRRGFRPDGADFSRQHTAADQVRVPPQNVEAEQSVLGSVMLDECAWPVVASMLEEEDFYRRDHQLIFRAIKHCAKNNLPFDAVLLGSWFEDQGQSEQVANGAYLVELVTTTPSAANVKAYAEIVRDKAVLRRLIHAGTNLVNRGFHPDGMSGEEVLAEAATSLSRIVTANAAGSFTAKEAILRMHNEMLDRYESGDDLAGLSTGIEELDDYTSGLQNGRVYGIGARPKMGKTTLAKEIVRHNIKKGIPAAVWTLEMGETEFMSTLVAAEARVDSKHLQRPKMLHDEDWGKVTEAVKTFKDAPLTLFPTRGVTIERIEAEAALLVQQGKCKLIAIDYLGLIKLGQADRHDIAIGDVTRTLKKMAGNLNVPVVIVFQLNRGNEQGSAVRPPRASDARDSGAIEQDLDCMILLHRPSYYDRSAPKGTQIIIPIQRNGPSGEFTVMEQLEYGIFNPGGQLQFHHEPVPRKQRGKEAAAGDFDDFPA